MSECQYYRDLTMLCIAFGLTDKGNKPTSIDEVRKKIEEVFPEEKNFYNLLEESISMGSILVENNNITITEIGVETARNLCNSIKRIIKRRQGQSTEDEEPNLVIALFLSWEQIEEMKNNRAK